MFSNKWLAIFFVIVIFSSVLMILGCPVNEEKKEKDFPPMTCERMVDYVYDICEYSFTEATGGGSVKLTNDEATANCEDWEGTSDWEGCKWECTVNCTDDRLELDDCESWKACQSLCKPKPQDDDDSGD